MILYYIIYIYTVLYILYTVKYCIMCMYNMNTYTYTLRIRNTYLFILFTNSHGAGGMANDHFYMVVSYNLSG